MSMRLPDPDRVLSSEQGATRRDLARYYLEVAPWILPHLADRPTRLLLAPAREGEPPFFQRHDPGYPAPEVLRRAPIQEKKKVGEYLIVDAPGALIGLVQMGALEIHTWGSRLSTLEQPDRLVLDLDPGPDVPWDRVVLAAWLLRDRLARLGLESFVKTTGGKGLHVVVPLVPGPGWGEHARFARAFAEAIAADHPAAFTASMSKAKRQGRIYIDHLRNVRGATTVAAYSPRARPGAPVSLPLAWEELDLTLRPDELTIRRVQARVGGLLGDPWARAGQLRQTLTPAMLRLVEPRPRGVVAARPARRRGAA